MGGWDEQREHRCQHEKASSSDSSYATRRPEAQGDGDWSFIGDTGDEETSILVWYVRLQQFHGYRPDRRGPMFLNHERSGAYLYSQFLRDFHVLQLRAGVSKDDLTGTAGLRSAGYTGSGLCRVCG